jgi:hypothetical protein
MGKEMYEGLEMEMLKILEREMWFGQGCVEEGYDVVCKQVVVYCQPPSKPRIYVMLYI